MSQDFQIVNFLTVACLSVIILFFSSSVFVCYTGEMLIEFVCVCLCILQARG